MHYRICGTGLLSLAWKCRESLTHWDWDKKGCDFADNIIKCMFLNTNVSIVIKISLNFIPKGSIDNIPALVHKMAWCRPGDKPLSEPMMVSLRMCICITWLQWVKYCAIDSLSWLWHHEVIYKTPIHRWIHFFRVKLMTYFYLSLSHWIDGLVQKRRNSIANALELRLSCTNPWKRSWSILHLIHLMNAAVCMHISLYSAHVGVLQQSWFILAVYDKCRCL